MQAGSLLESGSASETAVLLPLIQLAEGRKRQSPDKGMGPQLFKINGQIGPEKIGPEKS